MSGTAREPVRIVPADEAPVLGGPNRNLDTPARAMAWAALRRLRHRPGALPVLSQIQHIRAIVAYDGTAYAGWQRQSEELAVQDVAEVAFERITGTPAIVHGAGRTDAGVHAEGQGVLIRSASGLPPEAIQAVCEQVLPTDIAIRCMETAPEGFDAQKSVVRKLYRYRLLLGEPRSPTRGRTAWELPELLDVDAMRAAAVHVTGQHDFKAFRNDPGSVRRGLCTVRNVESVTIEQAFDALHIDVVGPGFLYMMVRNLTGTLVAVGRGELAPDDVRELRDRLERKPLPPPAPAHGLTLVRVEYVDGYGASGAIRA